MTYHTNFGHRKTIRLKDYDYRFNGFYYVTICTYGKSNYFGDLTNGKVALNLLGRMAERCWREIPEHFRHVFTDEFIAMPNHIHGILRLADGASIQQPWRLQPKQVVSGSLGAIIRSYKSAVSNATASWLRAQRAAPLPTPLWQRNYYESIIRNDAELQRIRDYIHSNPLKWLTDPENGSYLW